jgi:multiple sugar transport system ATP-binding protein
MGRVQLEDVTKRYDDVVAVDGMQLDISDGEFVTLVGPSGCGKSTTMEMIAGLTRPTAGKVRIGDREVTNLPPKDRGIAMVFQNIALFPHMTVRDNISFGLRLRKMDAAEIDRRVAEAAEVVELGGMLDRMPDELSGGQRQRVAIGRAIVRNPDVFLMDEPLANLDAKLRVHMRTQLQRLHRELDTTIIYVTHNQAEAMTMSDRVAVIDGGVLQQIAPPLECYDRPANEFVATFIGSPAMNIIDGRGTPDGVEATHADITVPIDGSVRGVDPGVPLRMGIRPEDVHLVDGEVSAEMTPAVGATIDVIEPMGNEMFVYLLTDASGLQGGMQAEADPGELLMSVDPDAAVSEGQAVEVALDRSKLHLFDAEGDAIVHGVGEVASPAETG